MLNYIKPMAWTCDIDRSYLGVLITYFYIISAFVQQIFSQFSLCSWGNPFLRKLGMYFSVLFWPAGVIHPFSLILFILHNKHHITTVPVQKSRNRVHKNQRIHRIRRKNWMHNFVVFFYFSSSEFSLVVLFFALSPPPARFHWTHSHFSRSILELFYYFWSHSRILFQISSKAQWPERI